MKNKIHPVSLVTGFLLLFGCYHAAEYMIVFRNNPAGFLACQAAFFLAAFLIGKFQFNEGLRAWGFYLNKSLFFQIFIGLITGILLYGITFFISLKTGNEEIDFIPPVTNLPGMFWLFIFGNIFSSLSEDILTRSYFYRHFKGHLNIPFLILLSAFIYIGNHIYRLSDGIETWLYLFLLGILLIIPLIKTKQIWMTGSIHWAGNCTFYFTHEIIKTTESGGGLSSNYIFSLVMMGFIVIFAIIPAKSAFYS